MFERLINIDGTEVSVPCDPSTPYSVVLQRAASILKREEEDARYNASLSTYRREYLR